MKLEDFYQLRIGQEVYYKDDLHDIISLKISCGVKYVGLKEKHIEKKQSFVWSDIMRDCSLEEPFEVKQNCKYHEIIGERTDFCKKEVNAIFKGGTTNCHSCPDYDKKNEKVRYYEHFVYDPMLNRERVTYLNPERNNKPFMPVSENGQNIYLVKKVCPETNRIYIEVME